jgi:DNA repair protein RadC
MESKVMYSEAFPSSPMRHYFFDYKQGPSGSRFMQISCSERQRDGSHIRSQLVVFESDLPLMVQALSSLFHHAGHLKEVENENSSMPVRERGIPSWDPDLKPRERMKAYGAPALADAELLALLIGSGIPDETAVDMGAKLLDAFGGLPGLAKATGKQLKKFTGIGLARSSSILSAIEIAKRLHAI